VTLAPATVRDLQSAVLDWYAANGRGLAFRQTRDPWAILVSEVMAQQTQAARAAAHWSRFMARYPTPAALAGSTPAEVIREWRGLGYNRRAVALRAAAALIVERHDGRVPHSVADLEALPGIGPYTARAVLAFAFDCDVTPLDTNVRRVLDRAIGPLRGRPRDLQAAVDGFVPTGAGARWGHALMDIGATKCVAREPRCGDCPLRAWCRTANGTIATAVSGGPWSAARSAARRRSESRPFPSTTRWLRGRILDRLRDAADGQWVAFRAPIGDHSMAAVRSALTQLGSEGMIEQSTARPLRGRLRVV
jgi:A/G-specific adenine glycosylase